MAKPVNHVFPGKPKADVEDLRHWLEGVSRLSGNWLGHHGAQLDAIEGRLAALEANGNGERG